LAAATEGERVLLVESRTGRIAAEAEAGDADWSLKGK
jgi:hypothetical protein